MGEVTKAKTATKIPAFSVPSLSSPSPSSSSSSSSSSSPNGFLNLLATSSGRQFNGDQNEIESYRSTVSSADSVFGSVPNRLEVEYAIAAFQSFMMQGLTYSMSKLDNNNQPLLNLQDSRGPKSTGFQRVYDAFRLLQTVPSVRRMVVSISSDKTVWDAVMRNNEVQKFQESLKQAEANRGSGIEADFGSNLLRWILDNMKLQILQLIETLKSALVNKSFESHQKENKNTELKEGFEQMIVSTVLLSIITLMIVLVTRAYGA